MKIFLFGFNLVFLSFHFHNLYIVAEALDGQQYPLPMCVYMWVCDGERGSGPEGADDLCLVSSRLEFEHQHWNLSLEAVICALRL